MRRLLLILILLMAASTCVMAGEDSPAILTVEDGRSFRVFLMSTDGNSVSTEFQKLRQKKTFEVAEIDIIKFTPDRMDDNELKVFTDRAAKLFEQADYEELITEVEPVVAPYGEYMWVNNNLQSTYGLLMQAYSRSGNHLQADAAANNLMKTADASLKLKAAVCAALAAADRKDIAAAQELLKQIENPAAALYVEAAIERAEGSTREALQTAVQVIVQHGDEMEWLAPVEFLCAELYLDADRTNSASVTARQTAKLYEGTNIGNEADALHSRIEQLTNKSE